MSGWPKKRRWTRVVRRSWPSHWGIEAEFTPTRWLLGGMCTKHQIGGWTVAVFMGPLSFGFSTAWEPF